MPSTQWTLNALDRSDTRPLFQQLQSRVRDAVVRGVLVPGERLPSSRALASQLGIARGTVEAVYSQLVGEGYLVRWGAAGTRVNPQLETIDLEHLRLPAAGDDRPVREKADAGRCEVIPPLAIGVPALDLFPRKLWSRIVTREARQLAVGDMAYPDERGAPVLREQLASYLAVARGIVCRPEQILITSGFLGAMGVIFRALLQSGDKVWIEDPGYFRVGQALEMLGAQPIPIPVDEEGLRVDIGLERCPQARLAMVTPANQAPLGGSLSLARRLELLDWARQADAWIVEDDYDSEFRYAGKPLAALKSLDRDERVFYVGTFSKVLFPRLRLGYMVVPEPWVKRLRWAARIMAPASGLVEQRAVATLMAEGHFGRHIRRMRQAYARRRQALHQALSHRTSDWLTLQVPDGGMQIIGWLKAPLDEERLKAGMVQQGLGAESLRRWLRGNPCPQALLLSFVTVPEDQADDVARRLAAALVQAEAAD